MIIGLYTYGLHTVNDPQQPGSTVRAYKLGYSAPYLEIILMLYGILARDVTPKTANYRYVSISGHVVSRKDYLFKQITNEQLLSLMAITRVSPGYASSIYLWKEDAWWSFPTAQASDFRKRSYGDSSPGSNPTYLFPSEAPDDDTPEKPFTITKTQLYPDKMPWYWIGGNTRPHKIFLRQHGCRWRSGRQQWSYEGWTLPDAIARMGTFTDQPPAPDDTPEPTDAAPESEAPTSAALTSSARHPDVPHCFKLGDVVFATHELPMPDGQPIATGQAGTVMQRYAYSPSLDLTGYSYTVDFERRPNCWVLESEISKTPTPKGIMIKRGMLAPPGAAIPLTRGELRVERFKNHDLPPLFDEIAVTATPKAPASEPPLAADTADMLAIFGGQITGKERDSNNDVIVKGRNGVFATRSIWINRQERRDPVWVFDLPPASRIGNPLPAIQKALQTNGAIYSLYTRKWHFDQADKVYALDKLIEHVPFTDNEPCTLDEAAAILGMRIKSTPIVEAPATVAPTATKFIPSFATDEPALPINQPLPDPDPVEPTVRITTPDIHDNGTPDAIQSAIAHISAAPAVQTRVKLTTGGKPLHANLRTIPQNYVGELTGSISGNVHCYGYGIHAGTCVYLNMGGPRMSVEAIRAKLSMGDIVSLIRWDDTSLELTAGEGNTGMYTAYMQNMKATRFTSLILLHDTFVNPNYGLASSTYLFDHDPDSTLLKLQRHLHQLVDIPIFDHWLPYLRLAGEQAGVLHAIQNGGDLTILHLSLNKADWTRLITISLHKGKLQLPAAEVS